MDDRLALALTLALPLLTAASAFAAIARPARALVGVLLVAAVIDAVAGVAILPGIRRGLAAPEAGVATWSPLGLYGVELTVRTQALGSFLAVPGVVAAVVGWFRAYGPPWRDPSGKAVPAGRPVVDAALLVAVSGGTWALVAGDLVSIVLGTGAFVVATAGALAAVGAVRAARWRLVVTGAMSFGLLVCMLLLGKVNGSFAAGQLASVSFSDASLAGLVMVASGLGNAVPFHAWALRLCRQPLMPAVAATGSAVSLALVDIAFVTTGGELAGPWRTFLTALGLFAIIGSIGWSWSTSHPRMRLATLLGGRTGLTLMALASGAPATMSALTLLHGVAATGAAILWVAAPGAAASSPPTPVSRATSGGTGGGGLRATRSFPLTPPAPAGSLTGNGKVRGMVTTDAWRSAVPWIVVLVVATAVGLPGTIGGLAADTYLSALTASSEAGGWLRLAALLLDTATIGASGAVLGAWLRPKRSTRDGTSRSPIHQPDGWAMPDDGWRARPSVFGSLAAMLPWLGVAIGLAVIVAPAVLPLTFVGPWFGPISVVAAGTSTPPRLVDALRIASPDRILLAGAAAVALYRIQKGEEMLPAVARAMLGIGVVIATPLLRIGRGVVLVVRGALDLLLVRLVSLSDQASSTARLVEERYYAAVAVVVIVVLLYSVGR